MRGTDAIITLKELCSGNIRHINLSQVVSSKLTLLLFFANTSPMVRERGFMVLCYFQTKLEQKLATLYGQLSRLQLELPVKDDAERVCSLRDLQEFLSDTCDDLLTLSLLVPNVPWVSILFYVIILIAKSALSK